MNRRSFMKILGWGTLAGAVSLWTGCAFKTRHSSIDRRKTEQPWRCAHCGLVMRSDADLSHTRCPRCFRTEMKKITEEDLQAILNG